MRGVLRRFYPAIPSAANNHTGFVIDIVRVIGFAIGRRSVMIGFE
jgi:hypothetical protein